MKQVFDIAGFNEAVAAESVVVVYYSTESCQVCKTLKPKIREIMDMQFPDASLVYIDTEKSPVLSGQHRVFSIPTIDIYVEGKSHARFSRNLALYEFEEAMRRPYEALMA